MYDPETQTARLLDFGIARDAEDNPAERLTRAGFFVGTLQYVAPEALSGELVDEQADVYSLATIAYHLLVGILPFPGRSPRELFQQLLTQSPIPLNEAVKGVRFAPAIERGTVTILRLASRDAARSFPDRHLDWVYIDGNHTYEFVRDDLASYYPSVTPDPAPIDARLYPAFRDFCLRNAGAIRPLVASRLVQTNEAGRSACLLPGYAEVSRREGGRPLALIDFGCSAGLNLLFDRFGYEYAPAAPARQAIRWGDTSSPVQLRCELRGEEVAVTVTDDSDGTVLVEEEGTTFDNGFVGYWLPRGVHATVTVEHEGRSGTAQVSTGEDDPTCLTTLELS